MPVSLSSPSHSSIITTLRGAGCVFAEDEARLLIAAANSHGELTSLVHRRVAGEPLEQILGAVEFCGLQIAVEPGVFVPRRRTGFLVRQAAALARPGAVVLDLCCGSGAAGVALAAALGHIELHAADVDPAAVRCARRNLVAAGTVYEGDLYQPLPADLRGRVDVLIVNAPYVPAGSIGLMPPEARIHEPRIALDGGHDGLDVQRRVVSGALEWLAPSGHLLIETSQNQAPSLAEIFPHHGLRPRVVSCQELDATVVIGSPEHPAGFASMANSRES